MRRLLPLSAFASLLLLASCDSTDAPAERVELSDQPWELVAFSDLRGNATEPAEGDFYRIEFYDEPLEGFNAHAIICEVGCGRCEGIYETREAGTINISARCVLRAGCRAEGLNRVFEQALLDVDVYDLIDGELRLYYRSRLTGEESKLTFRPQRAPAP